MLIIAFSLLMEYEIMLFCQTFGECSCISTFLCDSEVYMVSEYVNEVRGMMSRDLFERNYIIYYVFVHILLKILRDMHFLK